MKKNKIILTTIFIFSSLLVIAQEQTKIPIRYEEYRYYYILKNSNKDTVFLKRKLDSLTLNIQLYSDMGASYVKVIKTNCGEIVEEGAYVNSLDILKRYARTFDPITYISKTIVESYYEPLRNGEWKIYKNGKLNEIILYDKGMQIKKQKTDE